MRQKKRREVEVVIDGWSKSGNGTGTVTRDDADPLTVEVAFAVPGDKYWVELMRKRKGLTQSWPLTRLEDSGDRIAPKCAHFGTCGGCRWQQVDYPHQLQIKTELVKTAFSSVPIKDACWHPIIPCQPPWEYRNKMEFSFSQNRAGELFAGLYMSRGKVFNLTECHLVTAWFSEALSLTRSWAEAAKISAYHPPSNTGTLRTLTVREGARTGDRMVFLTLSGNPDFALKQDQIDAWVKEMQGSLQPEGDGKLSIFIRIQQITKGQPTRFYEMHLAGPDLLRERLEVRGPSGVTHSLEFQISPAAFFQPNTRQAEQLYSRALALANVNKDSVIFDLYCGTGTVGICLAREAKRGIGIELSPEAALDARENCRRNGIDNFEVITGDVGEILKDQRLSLPKPDLLVVDPPRCGLSEEALSQILLIAPEQIVYISCNPSTQAPNVAFLCEAGYQVEAIQPVDQFPHTPHVENIVTLKRHDS